MAVELRLPADVMAAVEPDADTERGPSEFTIALDVVGAVANVVTVAQVLKAAPELARRLRSWAHGRSTHPDERLVIKAHRFLALAPRGVACWCGALVVALRVRAGMTMRATPVTVIVAARSVRMPTC